MNKGFLVILAFMLFFGITQKVRAQRYRSENNLGTEEMVKFVATKDGDVLEFSWEINTTREIESIVLKKGEFYGKKVNAEIKWKTVKQFEKEDHEYVETLPQLGQLNYRLMVVGKDGSVKEYSPTYQVKKQEGTSFM